MKFLKIITVIIVALWASPNEARPLRFGLPNSISHLDQTKPLLAQAKYLLTLIHEPLVRANSNQELEPALSQSWKIDSAKNIASFTLAKGRKFSDGSSVTAGDVVEALHTLCASESDARKDLTAIAGCGTEAPLVRTIDESTIEIKFVGPAPILLYQLAGFRAGIFKKVRTTLVGSGPYFVKARNSDSLELLPNPHFFALRNVKNDGLTFIATGETNVVETVKEQKLDGTIMYRLGAVETPPQGFRVIDDEANITLTLVPNLQRPPFDNPAFRKSLMSKLANNQSFVTCSHASRAAKGLIPNGLGGSITHLPTPPPTGFFKHPKKPSQTSKITLHRHIGRKNDCEEKVLSKAFEELGVELAIKHHTDYGSLLPLYQNHDLDGFLELYIFAYREAMTIFRKFAKDGDNLANINSTVIDDGLERIWTAKSNSERFQTYRNLNQVMYNEALVFPLYYINHRNLISNCLADLSRDFAFNPFFGLASAELKSSCK